MAASGVLRRALDRTRVAGAGTTGPGPRHPGRLVLIPVRLPGGTGIGSTRIDASRVDGAEVGACVGGSGLGSA
ncbi:hypothetical protein ABZ135_18985 [Streptomyces sp. NPDC006339]|uniref:hypothetical protein n=1 Tax=Streptomyces sp. NPDC006339 TaxID=3156755 RepID=UPI0033BAC7CF